MRSCLAVLAVVGWAALAAAQDDERAAAQEAWRAENSKGLRLYQTGQYREALACWERALPLAEKAFGKQSPEAALSLNNLALVYQAQGQYAKALPLFKRALEVYEKA